MRFTSGIFLIFLLVVLILYFLVNKKSQWIVLLVASYIFYLASGIGMVFFLLFATLITFFTGILLEKSNNKLNLQLASGDNGLTKAQRKQYRKENKREKTLILLISLILIFGVLGSIKYYNDFALKTTSLLQVFTIDLSFPKINILRYSSRQNQSR